MSFVEVEPHMNLKITLDWRNFGSDAIAPKESSLEQ